MRAVLQSAYGAPHDVLSVGEVDCPEPADQQVLVRVRAASVHPDVWHVVRGWPYALRTMGSGLGRPKRKIPGTDLAGVVERVGSGVADLSAGDEVFGESLEGMQWMNAGAYAEYVAVARDSLAKKPSTLSFEQAACLPTSGFIALMNLDSSERVEPGRRVLVNGAAGCLGSIALQIAKAAGAHVTGVDEARKLDLMRQLGADEVIDYRARDFTREDQRYDLVFDVASTLKLSQVKRVLTEDGRYVLIGHDHFGERTGALIGSIATFLGLMVRYPFDKKHLPPMSFSEPSRKDVMRRLSDLAEAGKLTAVVARTYPLEEAARALEALQSGDVCGRLVITP